MRYFDVHICMLLEDPLLGMHAVEEQNDMINSVVGCLMQWFDNDKNYA